MEPPPYTRSDLHDVVRKQLATAASTALSATRLHDAEMDAIVYAARSLCRDEIERSGRLGLHGVDQQSDGAVVDAKEAYLSVAAGDPTGDGEWLSLTYWLSDLALADRDPERVRATIAAIERSAAVLRTWLAGQDENAVAPAEIRSGESPDS